MQGMTTSSSIRCPRRRDSSKWHTDSVCGTARQPTVHLSDRETMSSRPPSVASWPTVSLIPNPLNPRGYADAPRLDELTASIRAQGVLQPLLVTPDGVVMAGHRHLAPARMVGLTEVRCADVHRRMAQADRPGAVSAAAVMAGVGRTRRCTQCRAIFETFRQAWAASGVDVGRSQESWSELEDWYLREGAGMISRNELGASCTAQPTRSTAACTTLGSIRATVRAGGQLWLGDACRHDLWRG